MNIQEIFKSAVDHKASDIHLVVGRKPTLRIDGDLREIESDEVLTQESALALILPILSEHQKEKFEKERELDLSYEVPSLSRFRVNLHWEKGNIGLVARVVSSVIPSLEDLAMPEVIHKLLSYDQGLVLVTGPTGSGKSTSLAAMVNLINTHRTSHIVTLEDPIEFLYTSDKSIVKQRQLGTDILSFESGLKHVLRQDPDVIMVGEMRDLVTIAATMTLAETGHLVLATLHTISAAQTVDRIIDVFPPYQQDQIRIQLSITLRGIVSQKLLKKVGGGRVAAREILLNSPAVSNLIRENKIAQIRSVIQTSSEEGMVSMDQDLKRLFKLGHIDHDNAVLHMVDPQTLDT